jgi:hypothetical protein
VEKHPKCSNSRYENRFFESPPWAGFQKTDFGVSSAKGIGNTKVGFTMRIYASNECFSTNPKIYKPFTPFPVKD